MIELQKYIQHCIIVHSLSLSWYVLIYPEEK